MWAYLKKILPPFGGELSGTLSIGARMSCLEGFHRMSAIIKQWDLDDSGELEVGTCCITETLE